MYQAIRAENGNRQWVKNRVQWARKARWREKLEFPGVLIRTRERSSQGDVILVGKNTGKNDPACKVLEGERV